MLLHARVAPALRFSSQANPIAAIAAATSPHPPEKTRGRKGVEGRERKGGGGRQGRGGQCVVVKERRVFAQGGSQMSWSSLTFFIVARQTKLTDLPVHKVKTFFKNIYFPFAVVSDHQHGKKTPQTQAGSCSVREHEYKSHCLAIYGCVSHQVQCLWFFEGTWTEAA